MINSEIRNWMLKPYVFIWALIPVHGRFQFGLWPRRKPFHSEAREQHLFRYWSLITSALYFSIWSFFCSVRSKSIEFQCGRLLGLVSCQHYVVGRLGTRCLLFSSNDVCDCRSLVEITMRNWKCLCLLSPPISPVYHRLRSEKTTTRKQKCSLVVFSTAQLRNVEKKAVQSQRDSRIGTDCLEDSTV